MRVFFMATRPRRGRLAFLSVVLVVSLSGLVSAADAPPPGGTFVDDDGNVHEGYIEAIAAEGITRGCDPPLNIHYCPERTLTRGEMVAFLVRAFELPASEVDAFVDDDGSVFEGDIEALAAAGITKGCNPPTNTEFCPERTLTRGEMAAFLVRAFELPASEVDAFVDDDGSVFEGDIEALAAAGITKGCNPPTNTEFCPDRSLTRAEMASFLGRALGLTATVPAPRPVVIPGMLWSTELTAPDRPNNQYGPHSVAIYDRGVVMVDHQEVDNGESVTFIEYPVYAFESVAGRWVPTLLEPTDPIEFEELPQGISASGNRVAIAAGSPPAVYVFTRNDSGWSQGRIQLPFAGGFHGTVAMDGDRIVTGWDDTHVVVIDWDGAAWIPKLQEIEVTGGVGPLDVEGDLIAFGIPWESKAYVLTKNGDAWDTEELTRVGVGHEFGADVDVDDGRVLVGANGASPGPGGPGGLYLYNRQAGSWSGNVVAEGGAGFGDHARMSGSVIVCAGEYEEDRQSLWAFEQVDGNWSGHEFRWDADTWIGDLELSGRMGALTIPGGIPYEGEAILFELK
jgi:hypothetical protein